MSLMSVDESPVLRLVSKAASVDPDGTHELLRLGLYEALCDQVDVAKGDLERDLDTYFEQRNQLARRTLVRKFIDARLAGEGVEDVLTAAAKITLAEEFAKADEKATVARPDNPKTKWWDARDLLGRFTTAAGAVQQHQLDRDHPFDKPKYANMRATGAAISALSGDKGSGKIIGDTATALGRFSPEAEKVLGQGIRRTAYRFRGTEKLPDRQLKADIKNGLTVIDPNPERRAALQRAINAEGDLDIRSRALAGKPFDRDRSDVRGPKHVNPAIEIAQHWGRTSATQDQKQMAVAGDIAARYYLNKLPTPEQTAISIAAGALPPSQGVIIDADGDIVSEAMGYQGDHYVPFDLKNLRSLQGGQYVRTRASGGPTTEDIYTGLLSGARQIQVVSQSGVFTVEFDPSVRGGRRYSDKARQMVGRYERILDAIKNGPKAGLYQQDITPQELRDIQQKYGDRFTGEDLKTLVDRDVEQLRQSKSFKMLTEDEIETEARARLAKEPNANRSRLNELRKEVEAEARANSVKAFRLDGDGYAAALKTLKEEFPYFIRQARREPLPEFVDRRNLNDRTKYSNAGDRGYVSPKNKASGLADSITQEKQGYQVRRGTYEGPARTTGTKTTEEAKEGAGEAPKASPGRPASTHKVVTLDKALEDPTFRRMVSLHGANLDDAVQYLDVNIGDIEPEKDSEWRLLSPSATLAWVVQKAAEDEDGFAGYIGKQGPVEREKFLKALERLPGMLEQSNMDEADQESVADSIEQLTSALTIIAPLPKGDPLTHDPAKSPLHFDEIAALGSDLEAFERAERHAESHDQELHKFIVKFRDDPKANPVGIIEGLLGDYEGMKDGPERDATQASIERAQAAYSFVTMEGRAREFHALVGSPGKAAASREEAPETSLLKRHTPRPRPPVTWHRPGSQLATEFRKFLQSQ